LGGDRLTVGGSVTVTVGAGSDSVSIQPGAAGGAIGGDVLVGLGTGDGQQASVSTTAAIGLTIGGTLRVTTADSTVGSGTDDIHVSGVRVGRDTVLTMGAGADLVTIDNSSFAGPFTLTTGAGNDDVRIERAGTTGTTRFRGSVLVGTGLGNDTVAVGNSSAGIDQAVFAMGNMWDGGAGATDNLNILATGNEFVVALPSVAGFEATS
jgi:hypothetical protein